jgi:hypothetical protein
VIGWKYQASHLSKPLCRCQWPAIFKRKEMEPLLAVSIAEKIAEIIVFVVLLVVILYFTFRKK